MCPTQMLNDAPGDILVALGTLPKLRILTLWEKDQAALSNQVFCQKHLKCHDSGFSLASTINQMFIYLKFDYFYPAACNVSFLHSGNQIV